MDSVNKIKQVHEVIIFGAGVGGKRLALFCCVNGIKVKEFWDNDKTIIGNCMFNNILIHAPRRLEKGELIVACFEKESVMNEVKKQCLNLGADNSFVEVDWEILIKEIEKADDRTYLECLWQMYMNDTLDLDNPQTFNAKLQWLKLHIRDEDRYRMMADKVAVKGYVEAIIGKEYVVPTIGIWNSFEDIDFNVLPEQFILKCSHDSGSTEIVNSKQEIDYYRLKYFFKKKLSEDYYLHGRERCYKDIPRKIIAEPLLAQGKELKDYKIHVFNGKPRLVQVDMGRFTDHKRNMYTPDWEYLPFSFLYPRDESQIEARPKCMDEMLDIATRLAEDIPYVRVDFYIVDGQIYFGELTFFHGSGYEPFDPPEWDEIMGSWIKLPID